MLDDADVGRLRLLHAFTVPKRDDTDNEDRWFMSASGLTYAVSDGASVSFDAGRWATVLARRFTQDPDVSREWIHATVAEYTRCLDREAMSWMQQAAYDRGSFATLLGVAFFPNWSGARVLAIGDSVLAFIDRRQLVRTVPYIRSDEFDQSPCLLSANPFENRQWDDETISLCSYELNLASHDDPKLLLMTDALGRWLLDGPDSDRVGTLLDANDQQSFRAFVERERADGRLKRDDTTLVVIG